MKTLIAKILVLLGVLSLQTGSILQPAVESSLQLKVAPSQITASREVHEISLENGKIVDKGLVRQYQYVSQKKAKGNFVFDPGRTFTNKRLVKEVVGTSTIKQTVDFYNGDQFALQVDGSVNEIQYATTTVDAFNAQTTVSQRWIQTAYASTDFPTGSGDGQTGNSATGGAACDITKYNTVRNAATGNDANTTNQFMSVQGDRCNSLTDIYIYRAYLPADTSAIGSGNTVTAAELHMFNNGGGSGTQTNSVVTTSQASVSALATSDYSLVGGTSLGDAAYNGADAGGTEYTFTISSPNTNISKTGTTKLGLREKDHDIADVLPTHDWVASYASSENATSAWRPFYRITFSAASTPSIPIIMKDSSWW